MSYFYDRRLRQFVDASGSLRPLRSLRFMRDEDREMSINIQENGTAWTSTGTASVTFGIKAAPGEDSDTLAIIEPGDFAEADDIYTGTLELNGEDLSDLLGSDFSVKLFCQLVITDDNGTHKSDVIPVIMGNDIIRGNEGTPSALPDPDAYVAARAVLYDRAQSLSSGQQTQARSNIGLGTAATSNTGDFAPSAHTHVIADVTGLQTALDAKAPTAAPTFTGLATMASSLVNTTQTYGSLCLFTYNGDSASEHRFALGLGTAATSNTNDFAPSAHTHPVSDIVSIAGNRLLGRHAGGSGAGQEVTVGNGLEFQGSGIRRAALTGDVTASAGSNSTTASANISRVMHGIAVGFVLN